MRNKIFKMSLAITFGMLAALPQRSAAQSCLPFLTRQNENYAGVKFVSMNKNGLASWSQFTASYRDGKKIPNLPTRPAQWFINYTPDVAEQLFSDRLSGPATSKQQPFAINQPDLINVVITVEKSPQVTVTLRSWGNAKAVFRGACSAGGVIHGSTPDVDYLLQLTQYAPVG
jgi:hypothetical protein